MPPKSTGLKWPPDQKVFDAFNASLSSITGPWYRVFLSANSNTPLYFGAHSSSRFDPKSGRFGVCYFARTPESAFAEALDHLIDENGALESIHARSRFISSFMISPKGRNEPRAYDLTGKGLRRFHATPEYLNGSTARGFHCSRAWANRLMNHPSESSGILYRGRASNEPCLALFGPKNRGFEIAETEYYSAFEDRKTRTRLSEAMDFHKWTVDFRHPLIDPEDF